VTDVIQRYLDCRDLHFGFARVKCEDCGHEYLLAFSCKRRHFCPSCHQKRVVEFGEWLCTEVLKYVPHRQWVFSIPKRLRLYFMHDRKLLTKLSRCAWPPARRPTARRVIFKIFILIFIFSQPMAAFTTTTPSWYAHHPKLVILKSCFAMKYSKCSKLKAK
jgi:ribosomal protein S27E